MSFLRVHEQHLFKNYSPYQGYRKKSSLPKKELTLNRRKGNDCQHSQILRTNKLANSGLLRDENMQSLDIRSYLLDRKFVEIIVLTQSILKGNTT